MKSIIIVRQVALKFFFFFFFPAMTEYYVQGTALGTEY